MPLIKKRVLIAVRTYPVPSLKSIEASCTAGVTDNGQWIRLFPVPYRLMDEQKRFSKWDWIEVKCVKANDGRPESYKIDAGSIIVGDRVGTENKWEARRKFLEPLKGRTLCALRRQRDNDGFPTLGIIRPHHIKQLIIEPIEANWSEEERAILQRDDLFQKAPAKTLEKIPFNFKYEFTCGDVECRAHTMMCTDWEMAEAYRSWRLKYGDDWEVHFRNKFEREMQERYDTHFFVGTVHQHPGSWIIVGLFYPTKPPEYQALL